MLKISDDLEVDLGVTSKHWSISVTQENMNTFIAVPAVI